MKDYSEEWKQALLDRRGIRLDVIDATISSARGKITDARIDKLRTFRNDSEYLFLRDEVESSMWAGQALFEAANAMQNDIDEKREILAGRGVVSTYDHYNSERTKKALSTHEQWQKRADAKWKQLQHKDKSASEIAKLIARAGEKPETIRRRIKKLA